MRRQEALLSPILSTVMGCLLALIQVVELRAQEPSSPEEGTPLWSGGFESDFANGYFWHGLRCSRGDVIQSSAWISAKGFTFTLWSNLEPNAESPTPAMNEVDAGLDYTAVFGPIYIEPAVNYCFFPNQSDIPTTVETSVRAAISLGVFEPFMLHTVDVKAYSGAYFGELGVCGSWPLADYLSFESTAEIGWGSRRFNEAYVEIAQPSIQLVQWDIALTWSPSATLYVTPHAGLSAVTDKSLRKALDNPAIVQGGIRVGMEF